MAHDPTHDEHHANVDHAAMGIEHEHPTWSTYWKVALILTLITVVEVWVYYIPSFVASRAVRADAADHVGGEVRDRRDVLHAPQVRPQAVPRAVHRPADHRRRRRSSRCCSCSGKLVGAGWARLTLMHPARSRCCCIRAARIALDRVHGAPEHGDRAGRRWARCTSGARGQRPADRRGGVAHARGQRVAFFSGARADLPLAQRPAARPERLLPVQRAHGAAPRCSPSSCRRCCSWGRPAGCCARCSRSPSSARSRAAITRADRAASSSSTSSSRRGTCRRCTTRRWRITPSTSSQHLMFMAAAVLMWWPLLSPLPELPRLAYPGQMLYCFLMSIPMSIVAVYIAIRGPRALSRPTPAPPRIWGISPMEDQLIGGADHVDPGGLFFFVDHDGRVLQVGRARHGHHRRRTGRLAPGTPDRAQQRRLRRRRSPFASDRSSSYLKRQAGQRLPARSTVVDTIDSVLPDVMMRGMNARGARTAPQFSIARLRLVPGATARSRSVSRSVQRAALLEWKPMSAATLTPERTATPVPTYAPPPTARPPRERLLSLDVFRGMTIAGMLLVNNPGTLGRDLSAARARGVARVDADRPDLPVLPVHRRHHDAPLARGASRARR